MAVFFIEGPDRCGKSTQIKRLMSRLAREDIYEGNVKPIQWLHYSAVKNVTAAEQKALFRKTFEQMFQLVRGHGHWILDRSHLGDFVYAPLYRNDVDVKYVFELEENQLKFIAEPCVLLLFYDSSFGNLKRDDGDSLNSDIDLERAKEEMTLFRIAFNKSKITSKLEIDIANKSPEEIEQIVWDYVQKIVYAFPKFERQKFAVRSLRRQRAQQTVNNNSNDCINIDGFYLCCL